MEATDDGTAPWSPPDWRRWLVQVEAVIALLVGLSCLGLGHIERGLLFLLVAALFALVPGARTTGHPRS